MGSKSNKRSATQRDTPQDGLLSEDQEHGLNKTSAMQSDTSPDGLLSEHDEDGSDSHPPASSQPERDVGSRSNKRSAMKRDTSSDSLLSEDKEDGLGTHLSPSSQPGDVETRSNKDAATYPGGPSKVLLPREKKVVLVSVF